ncbi:Monothiol glutaredoxin-S17 [Zea mays]|uniref:Monothiol glutaredoxin-S17 n=1 Tax=Zea mays TaxID=4577 RepID=A0A1D6ETY4_MAIZE|nr:Monothiol glutaredoxin-S17 [Zea mays]
MPPLAQSSLPRNPNQESDSALDESDGRKTRRPRGERGNKEEDEGVLDTEELAIVNSTFRKAKGSRLPGIIEETRRSGESTTSTLESETWAMESLETELFDNVRASIQRSLGKPDKLLGRPVAASTPPKATANAPRVAGNKPQMLTQHARDSNGGGLARDGGGATAGERNQREKGREGTNLAPEASREMARTQKNKATAHHLGLLKQKGVNILKQEGVKFGSFDILTDNDVREGMKKFSNWPTVPQLYCKGELLGGCDIVIAMHDSGELKDVFEEHNIPLKPQGSKNEEAGQPESSTEKGGAVAEPIGLTDAQKARLESLINYSPVMVFIKGTPEEPRCGFSGKLVHILKQENIPFSSFDILSDDEVRQGLKVLSNWPSYPQLYIKGELVGGSDIVMEMHKSGELKKVLSEKGVIPKESLEDRLKSLVSSAPVMLLMKGTPDAPRCGFSSKVVNALKKKGVSFGSFDILSDEEVRQGLKTYSNWPTFPQLYYKSELIVGM